jgi:hypothetical protein
VRQEADGVHGRQQRASDGRDFPTPENGWIVRVNNGSDVDVPIAAESVCGKEPKGWHVYGVFSAPPRTTRPATSRTTR